MISPVRRDLYRASISRNFTSFGTRIVLADNSLSAPNGSPGGNINHLPSELFVVAGAGDILAWTDVLGNVVTLTFTGTTFAGTMPFNAVAIEASTTVKALVVSWNVEP